MGEVAANRVGPKLVIDQFILYQLVSFPAFAEALPPGCDDLAPEADKVRKECLAIAMGETCLGCKTIKAAIQPFQDALGKRLAVVHQTTPYLLDPLIELIRRKRGYRPTPIVMYYKDNGVTQTLSI